jgi:hypothetical protein
VQKLVILSDFDSCFVGRVRGYRIENGDLVPDASGVIHQQTGSVMAKRSMSTKSPAVVSSEAERRLLIQSWRHGMYLGSTQPREFMGNSAIGNREMLQEEELPAFGYPASLRKEMLDYMLAGLRDGGAKVGYRLNVGSVPPAPVDDDGYSGASIVVRRSSGFMEDEMEPSGAASTKSPAVVPSDRDRVLLIQSFSQGRYLGSTKGRNFDGNSALGNRQAVEEEELPALGYYPSYLREQMIGYMLAGLREGGDRVGLRIRVGTVPPAPVDDYGRPSDTPIVIDPSIRPRYRRSSGFIEGSPVASAGIGFVVGTAIGAGVMHLARRSS